MFGNDQIETLAERFLRGKAEQCGRGLIPANDDARATCVDDRVSDLIDNHFSYFGLFIHGHALRVRNHRFDRGCPDLVFEGTSSNHGTALLGQGY